MYVLNITVSDHLIRTWEWGAPVTGTSSAASGRSTTRVRHHKRSSAWKMKICTILTSTIWLYLLCYCLQKSRITPSTATFSEYLCLPLDHEESLVTSACSSEAGVRPMLDRPNHQLLSRPLIGQTRGMLASDWPRLGCQGTTSCCQLRPPCARYWSSQLGVNTEANFTSTLTSHVYWLYCTVLGL